MRSLINYIMIIFASIFMVACQTTPTHNHLDAGARPHIKTVDSILIAKQTKIGADIKQGSELAKILSFAQANPIPILVDAGVTGVRLMHAHRLAKPMRKTLDGFDFPVEFREHVKQSLAGSKLNMVDEIQLRRQEHEGFRGQYILNSEADAVLMIDMRYGFTPKFDRLYVAASALMFPKTDELTPFQEERGNDQLLELSDNIYRNSFVAAVSPDDPDGSTSENAAYWASLSEEELTVILQAAALRLSDHLAEDISLDDVTAPRAPKTADDSSDNDQVKPNHKDTIEVEVDETHASLSKSQKDS